MRTLKIKIYAAFIVLLLALLVFLSACNNNFNPNKYKYWITSIAGDYHSIIYYTNEYTLNDGCVSFTGCRKDDQTMNPYTVCGSFLIE